MPTRIDHAGRARAPLHAPSSREVITSFMLSPLRAPLRPVAAGQLPTIDPRANVYRAPNGNALSRVNVKLPNADSAIQYALVDSKSRQFYFVRASADQKVGLVEGPTPLPTGLSPSAAQLATRIKKFMLTPESKRPSPLPAEAGADAPQIDVARSIFRTADGARPLLRVDVKLPNADSPVQFALVDAQTQQFFFVRAQEDGKPGLVSGPAPLPKS